VRVLDVERARRKKETSMIRVLGLSSALLFAVLGCATSEVIVDRPGVDRGLGVAPDKILEAKEIRIVRQEPKTLPAVNVDSDLIVQVLLGLLSNAADAVPRGGEVLLDARAGDGVVEIGVADSGPGISSAARSSVTHARSFDSSRSALAASGAFVVAR
jgi:signal transduction histidine kinase